MVRPEFIWRVVPSQPGRDGGMGSGDRVAVFLENRFEVAVSIFGILKAIGRGSISIIFNICIFIIYLIRGVVNYNYEWFKLD